MHQFNELLFLFFSTNMKIFVPICDFAWHFFQFSLVLVSALVWALIYVFLFFFHGTICVSFDWPFFINSFESFHLLFALVSFSVFFFSISQGLVKTIFERKVSSCDFHNLFWFCSVNLCVCEAFGDERDFLFEFEFSVLFQHCFYFHLKASKIAKLRWGQTYFDKKKPSHLHLIAIRIFSCRGWIAFALSVCVTERMK